MPFPNRQGKHAGRPLVTPGRLLEYRVRQGVTAPALPRGVVLTWQKSLERRVRERREYQELPWAYGSVAVLSSGLGFARLPISAPVAAIAVEEFAALGAAAVIGIGTAGAIGGGLAAGDLVVCSGALRDEGTSHHYAPPERFARPDPGLTRRLRERLPTAVSGPTWTRCAARRPVGTALRRRRREAGAVDAVRGG